MGAGRAELLRNTTRSAVVGARELNEEGLRLDRLGSSCWLIWSAPSGCPSTRAHLSPRTSRPCTFRPDGSTSSRRWRRVPSWARSNPTWSRIHTKGVDPPLGGDDNPPAERGKVAMSRCALVLSRRRRITSKSTTSSNSLVTFLATIWLVGPTNRLVGPTNRVAWPSDPSASRTGISITSATTEPASASQYPNTPIAISSPVNNSVPAYTMTFMTHSLIPPSGARNRLACPNRNRYPSSRRDSVLACRAS